VLLLVDAGESGATDPNTIWPDFVARLKDDSRITVIRNKVDLSGETAGLDQNTPAPLIRLSAASGEGVETLREHLKDVMGFQAVSEGGFTARQRHIDALNMAFTALEAGRSQLHEHGAAELLAEDLRAAQDALGEVTGQVTPDDLLGKIFSTFCIGK